MKKIGAHFDEMANVYDDTRENRIPLYESFYKTGIDFLDCQKERPEVLDLGAGTGIFSSFLLKRFPQAKITMIDLSESMIDIAKEKFKDKEYSYIIDNYLTHNYKDEKYDIIISALSIHHFNATEKEELYKIFYGLLSPNGEIILADIIKSEFENIDEKFEERWLSHVQESSAEKINIENFKEAKTIDNPSKMSEHIKWIKNAEFSSYEFIYRYLKFGVLYAKK